MTSCQDRCASICHTTTLYDQCIALNSCTVTQEVRISPDNQTIQINTDVKSLGRGIVLQQGYPLLKVTLYSVVQNYPINNSTPITVFFEPILQTFVVYITQSGTIPLFLANYDTNLNIQLVSVDPGVQRIESGNQIAAYSRYGVVTNF